MGTHWFLLLLLLLSGDRTFNLPGSVLVWAVASGLRSTEGSVLDENLSCSSTSSVVLHRSKESTSKSQEQMISPQSGSETGPTERTASTVHTAVTTVTNGMPQLDPTVTSTAKEPVGSSTTTKFTLATSAETTQPNQTPPSSTPDKDTDTNEPLPTATTATIDTSSPTMTTVTIDTSSPTTTTLRTTVLSTTTSETQERDTTTVPPTPVTSPTTSKPPDTHHSTVTQTPSQPLQTGSDVGVTELTTLSPPRSITTEMRSSESPNPGETDVTMTTPLLTPSATPSMASSTAKHTILSSGTGTPTVPEKLTLTPPSTTPDKVIDTIKPLPVATTATIDTSLPTMTTVTIDPSLPTTTTLRTIVLSTTTSETQERDTTAVPPTPVTSPTTSKPLDTHHSTVTQTPSQTVQMSSSNSLGTTQSSDHSTGIVPSSSETTKSSTLIGTGKAPPNSSPSGGSGGGPCALDEDPDSTGGCACKDSYYSHLELSREIATLRCRPQDIEVSLRSCFLKTQHWVLKQDAFEKCFSSNTTEEGHRVRVFQLEKKEGTCGLHISTNSSHALHSLDVHLEQALPGSNSTAFRVLHFSCAYPLAVNVSKPVSYQEVSIPSIHVPNTGETVIILNIFTDSELSAPIKNSTAAVGMPLYVVLTSTNTDPDRFALVVNEIFASTNFSNTEAKATYHFVKESCPVRGRMLRDLSNGVSMFVTLAFTLSRFLNSDMLYLHARVTLCDKQVGQPCQPSPEPPAAGAQQEPG